MRLLRNARAGLVVAAGLAAAPAWAQGGDQGLPQFDTSLYLEQVFWLVVTFALLYGMMAFVALPRVAGTKDNRQRIISAELAAAETANADAKAAVVQVEKSLAEARAHANQHVTDMLAELSADTATRQAAQIAELKRRLHRAEADIAVAREAALKKIHEGAAGLAAVVVDAMTGHEKRNCA